LPVVEGIASVWPHLGQPNSIILASATQQGERSQAHEPGLTCKMVPTTGSTINNQHWFSRILPFHLFKFVSTATPIHIGRLRGYAWEPTINEALSRGAQVWKNRASLVQSRISSSQMSGVSYGLSSVSYCFGGVIGYGFLNSLTLSLILGLQ
jgi:hypothetical protein